MELNLFVVERVCVCVCVFDWPFVWAVLYSTKLHSAPLKMILGSQPISDR